ncbi:MAG: acetyltransferase [Clostridium lundense]|nr:acetyltransferase [Clostridium lundense]
MEKKQKLVIIGAGELGRQVAHYAELDGHFEIVGFFDDTFPVGENVAGKPVMGNINEVQAQYFNNVFDCLFIAIGYNHFDFKALLYKNVVSQSIPLATIVSPQVYVDPTAKIGAGSILYPGCIVEKDAVVEDNVAIMVNATIAHNSKVGKHSFIAGGAVLAGYAQVGKRCFVGVNSVINDHIAVCDDVTIGSLTVVGKNIKKAGVYFNDNRRLFRF